MIQPDRLDRFFPIKYPNGNTVSRFAKHCPHCKQLVKASAMEGMALLLQDKVFVLAEARCPQCQHGFTVKCVIDEYKQVHPVGLPSFLYRIMLQWGARKQVHTFRQQAEWRMAQQAADDAEAAQPSGTQLPCAPYGTRRGRCTTATGGAAKFWASMMSSRDSSLRVSCDRLITQPSSSPAVGDTGANTGSAPRTPSPRWCSQHWPVPRSYFHRADPYTGSSELPSPASDMR